MKKQKNLHLSQINLDKKYSQVSISSFTNSPFSAKVSSWLSTAVTTPYCKSSSQLATKENFQFPSLYQKPQLQPLSVNKKEIKQAVDQKLQFYKSFKKASKSKSTYGLPLIHVAFIEAIEEEKVMPEPIGIFKQSSAKNLDEDNINIQLESYSIGDKYCKVFSKALKNFGQVQQLNVKNNRLSDKGTAKLLKSLKKEILNLNISQNKVGSYSLKQLRPIIMQNKIKELNLEDCKMGDSLIRDLYKSLQSNYSIIYLNLSKNGIGSEGASLVGELLETNNSIIKLDLS